MGIQSGVMAQQFGMNFQFGKRKISAMSNEEFNKLTPAQLQADMNEQIKLLIPTFGEALREMRPFQRMIFEEMLAVMKTAIDVGIDVAKAGVDPLAHIFGQHVHGSGIAGPQPDFKPPPPGFTSGGSEITSTNKPAPRVVNVHRHTPEHHIGPGAVSGKPVTDTELRYFKTLKYAREQQVRYRNRGGAGSLGLIRKFEVLEEQQLTLINRSSSVARYNQWIGKF